MRGMKRDWEGQSREEEETLLDIDSEERHTKRSRIGEELNLNTDEKHLMPTTYPIALQQCRLPSDSFYFPTSYERTQLSHRPSYSEMFEATHSSLGYACPSKAFDSDSAEGNTPHESTIDASDLWPIIPYRRRELRPSSSDNDEDNAYVYNPNERNPDRGYIGHLSANPHPLSSPVQETSNLDERYDQDHPNWSLYTSSSHQSFSISTEAFATATPILSSSSTETLSSAGLSHVSSLMLTPGSTDMQGVDMEIIQVVSYDSQAR
ncbi:uncharacterized protein I303_106666 [Kwoniella dejecticola CBS 10117]|uniref:Uncharacterized protein n=1 Tax=Kwoniella dejecticola CBS 10117 TaxID=1296121 RepID=A0A1A5ZU45_9TREE|nr:uncharacterized protein I303_08691 [Kwoniella dejecticola CBS 10117]OBR81305.1 hypothetical protein I303_08691 [Kwoniella dejecticola CBS 10117]